MNTTFIVLIVVHINCILCHGFDPECTTKNGTVIVPVAVVVIFALAFLLMVLLLSLLLYVLVKTKGFHIFHRYKVSAGSIVSAAKSDVKSIKCSNLENSNCYELKDTAPNQTQKSYGEDDTLKAIKTELNALETKETEITGDHPPRPTRSIVKDVAIILPEQMSQICREVLKKTNKNGDFGGSLLDIDKLLKETEPKTDEKSTSRPVMAASHLYDVVPSTLEGMKEKDDTAKEEKATQETAEPHDSSKPKLNYIEPCFTLVNSHKTIEKDRLSPVCDYAVLSGISVPHNKVDDNYYQFPNPCPDENMLYINANINRHKASD